MVVTMPPRAAFVVVAAGVGRRFGHSGDKVFADLSGRPILVWALDAAARSAAVGHVVIVARESERERARAVATTSLPSLSLSVVAGGSTRTESEAAGLEALAAPIGAGEIEVVAIHDAARPFLTVALLDSVIEAATQHGGALPGREPTDAIWDVTADPRPLDKRSLRSVQTPQAFAARQLLDAHRRGRAEGYDGADTAATVVRFTAITPTIVPADRRNLKITFGSDLDIAHRLAASWGDGRWLD